MAGRPRRKPIAVGSLAPGLLTRFQDFLLETPFLWVLVAWLFAYIMVGLVFFCVYLSVPELTAGERQPQLWEVLSFSFITQATIGYGDVTPHGWLQFFANLQAVVGIGLNGAALGILTFRILRRRPPIKVPPTVAFFRDNQGKYAFWFRYLNVDTKFLADVSVTVFFSINGHSSNPHYDAVGGKVGHMFLPSVPPLHVMALFIPAAKERFDLFAPGSEAMKNDAVVPLEPSMFCSDLGTDRSARLILTITGSYSATGESFSFVQHYFAQNIVCGGFDSIDNADLLGLSPFSKRRAISRKYHRHVPSVAEHCAKCVEGRSCPFQHI